MIYGNSKDRIKKLLLELSNEIDKTWGKNNIEKKEIKKIYDKIWEFKEKL